MPMKSAEEWMRVWTDGPANPNSFHFEEFIRAIQAGAARAQRESDAVYHGGIKPRECRCNIGDDAPLVTEEAPK